MCRRKELMKKHVIFLNGPPRCGKDTLADKIKAIIPSKIAHLKFAEEVKKGTHEYFGCPKDIPADYYENVKDEPLDIFEGKTPREAYIWYSEEYMKPKHGKDIFGRLLAGKINTQKEDIIVISDSGFIEEFYPVSELNDFTLVKIIRNSLNFAKDSRSYWVNAFYPDVELVVNNGSEFELAEQALRILKKVLDSSPDLC